MAARSIPSPHEVAVVREFLTATEHELLRGWAAEEVASGRLKPNARGANRYFVRYPTETRDIPEVVQRIRARVLEYFDVREYEDEPRFPCFLGCHTEGGYVHSHTDPEAPGRHHVRFNLVIAMPAEGGAPVIDGRALDVDERDLWCFHPCALRHESTPVVGSGRRLILSLGVLVPEQFERSATSTGIAAYQAWEKANRAVSEARRHWLPNRPAFAEAGEDARTTADQIASLQTRLPLAEIVRFPQQPAIAVPRAYWTNQIAVRGALPRLFEQAGDPEGFVDVLRDLHRLATMGESGRSYYGAAGTVVTTPGELRTIDLRTEIDGPMLSAMREWAAQMDVPLQNGGTIESAGQPAVLRRSDGRACRHLYQGGVSMLALIEHGRLALLRALDAADRHDTRACEIEIGIFHRAFVAAHPFGNVNNSIAMNIVNALLVKAGGRAMPHLLLDHLALRLTEEDYTRAFAHVASTLDLQFSRGSSGGEAVPLLHMLMRAERAAAKTPAPVRTSADPRSDTRR